MKYFLIKNKMLKCTECDTVFTLKKNLYAHLRKFHQKEPCVSKKNPDFTCTVCLKIFSSKNSLMVHSRYHEKDGDHNYPKKSRNRSRLLCPYESCVKMLFNHAALRNHLEEEHSVTIELENLEFTSMESFEAWKNVIQQSTVSMYSRDTAPKKLSGTVQKQYLDCHRSYSFKPHGKNERRLKSMGSSKTGKTCPSRMEVSEIKSPNNLTVVKVKFWKTHWGHKLELNQVPLDRETRCELAVKLAEGASFDDILHSVRNDEGLLNHRLSLLTRKDLHNIVRDFKIDYKGRHNIDCDSECFETVSCKDEVTELESLLELPEDKTVLIIYNNDNIVKKAELVVDLLNKLAISEENSKIIENKLDCVLSILNLENDVETFSIEDLCSE